MATIRVWRSVLLAFAVTALLMTGCGGGGSNPPTAPTGVSATPGDTQVTLAWATVFGATSYNIYWATSAGVTPATGTKIGGATTPYAHTGLTNGTTYYYVVTAVNANGESTASAEVSAVPAVNPAPAAPSGVTATAGDGQVTLTWTDVAGATSYNIYWSTSAGVTPATGTKIEGATTPYSHTGLTNGTTYYYVVTAVNANGESTASAEISAVPAGSLPPAAPGGVTATAGDGQVTLTWTDVAGATSYNVYWSTSAGVTPATGTRIVGAAKPFAVTGLTNGTTYYFIVTALNAFAESTASARINAIPTTAPLNAPFIQATVLTLNTGTSPFGWLQRVKVCSSASCNAPISNATVSANGTALTYNTAKRWYQGNLPIARDATVNLSVTVNGTVYTTTGTQFNYAPFITSPDPGATLPFGSIILVSWLNFIPEAGSVYAVGVLDSTGNFVYPAGATGPKTLSISTYSDTVPAGTLIPGNYLVLVGTATPGIDDYIGGIPIANAGFGSGLWFINVVSFNEFTVQ